MNQSLRSFQKTCADLHQQFQGRGVVLALPQQNFKCGFEMIVICFFKFKINIFINVAFKTVNLKGNFFI